MHAVLDNKCWSLAKNAKARPSFAKKQYDKKRNDESHVVLSKKQFVDLVRKTRKEHSSSGKKKRCRIDMDSDDESSNSTAFMMQMTRTSNS